MAGGDGGALHGDAQLQRHEGGHCLGPANQLQVVDCNLDLELRSALICNGFLVKLNILINILIFCDAITLYEMINKTDYDQIK